MDSVNEKLENAIAEKYRNEIIGISSVLEESNTHEGKANIAEDIFVNVFLPFFAGEENIYKVGLGNWVTVATNGGSLPGGQFREVDVIDDKGKVLFTVPPIYDRNALNPVKLSDRIALPQLMEQAEQLGSIKPALQTKMKNQIFEALLNKMRAGNNNAREYLLKWNDIFTRYDREGIFQEEKNSSDKSSESGNNDYEIEDL